MSSISSILAIDPTTYGLAFVAFEGGELLDWGQRYSHREGADLVAVVDQLLDGTAADVLVLEDPDDAGCRRRERIRTALRQIAAHVRQRHIRVQRVARQDVRDRWAANGLTRKEAVAAAIAEYLPELAPQVPPKRKISRTEDGRVNLFDAASLALHAFPELEAR